ncbi:hypothetical protein Btru_054439 [Bulinus truncatus]|nr:hypothetical protein Btru_054439 [Bulinus truncatus]
MISTERKVGGNSFAQNASYDRNIDHDNSKSLKDSFSENLGSDNAVEDKPLTDNSKSCESDAFYSMYPDKCDNLETVNGNYKSSTPEVPQTFDEETDVREDIGGEMDGPASVHQASSDNSNHSNKLFHFWNYLVHKIVNITLALVSVSVIDLSPVESNLEN